MRGGGKSCAIGAEEVAAVTTVTWNCDGTVTLVGAVHVLPLGPPEQESDTEPLYPVGEITESV